MQKAGQLDDRRQDNPIDESAVNQIDLLFGKNPRYGRIVHTYYRGASSWNVCVCVKVRIQLRD